jgi:hypothetical protein
MKILFVFAAAILAAVSAPAGENLVPSGGFEEFTTPQHNIQNDLGQATYAPWRIFCVHDGNASVPRWFYAGLSKDAAEGKQAFSFAINESDDRGDCGIDLGVPIEPGATYKISFAAKDAGGCPQVNFTIAEWKKSGSEQPESIVVNEVREIHDLTPEYQTFTTNYTVRDGQSISLAFRPFDSSVGGLPQNACTMLLDAVRMEKVTTP